MKNNKLLAQEWFKVAEDDLAYAKVGLKEDRFFSLIAFHAQQSAEKYLKGFLVIHNIKPPRYHDLVHLIKLCQKINPDFSSLRSHADKLNPYAVDTRYPVFYPIVRKKYAEEAVTLAEDIIEFIKSSQIKR